MSSILVGATIPLCNKWSGIFLSMGFLFAYLVVLSTKKPGCFQDYIWMIYTLFYAIRSGTDGRVYVGFSHNVEERLLQHNAGKTRSTKGYRPWGLIFCEEVQGRAQARNREKYYKTVIGKEFLKSLDIKDGPVIQRIEYLPAAGRYVS